MRLGAPIDHLQEVLASIGVPHKQFSRTIEVFVSEARVWAQSLGAKIALYHAIEIWNVLSQALADYRERTADIFSLVHFVAISQAAVVAWAIAGVRLDGKKQRDPENGHHCATDPEILGSGDSSQQHRPLPLFNGYPVHRGYSSPILLCFRQLLRELAPPWFVQPLFVETATKLAETPFPLLETSVESRV